MASNWDSCVWEWERSVSMTGTLLSVQILTFHTPSKQWSHQSWTTGLWIPTLMKLWRRKLLHSSSMLFWSKEHLPLEEDQVRADLNKLEIHKSMWPDGMDAPTSAEGAGQYHYKATLRLPLKSHDRQGRFTKTGREQTLLLSSGRTRRRIERTTDQSASPQFLERWWSK